MGIRERFPELYRELREVAAAMLSRRAPQSLTATELTHEAFARLDREEARRRLHQRSELGSIPEPEFLACFGAVCHDLLVDRMRRRQALKRGGGQPDEPLRSSVAQERERRTDFLDLENALAALARESPELAELAELRFVADYTMAECSIALEVPVRTLERRWRFARAWLLERLR